MIEQDIEAGIIQDEHSSFTALGVCICVGIVNALSCSGIYWMVIICYKDVNSSHSCGSAARAGCKLITGLVVRSPAPPVQISVSLSDTQNPIS